MSLPYIDQILENENLTSDLEDAEAKVLINWGVGHATRLVETVNDESLVEAKVGSLTRLMRGVSRLIARRLDKDAAELNADLAALSNLQETVFGTAQAASASDLTVFATQLQQASAIEAMKRLLEWLTPSPTPEASVMPPASPEPESPDQESVWGAED